MKFLRQENLTVHTARELEHMGFIVKFVDFTINGAIFNIFVKEA